jgi:hypothetical protein
MKMELAVQNMKCKLEKRNKLLKAQEFYMGEFEKSKGNDKKIAQMHYFGVVNHIKQLDFEIALELMELEIKQPETPMSSVEQRIASMRTMVVG